MKILGIDTTSKYLCLGIFDFGKIYEYNLETGRRLSSLITITIKRVLESLDWQIKDIDYFACSLGPGSFTGTRIGVATIKGLSWAANKRIIGIPSLDILAMNAKDSDKPIVPIVDARRNLIYCSIYKKKEGKLKRIKPYMLLTEKELCKNIKSGSVLLGDAIGLYRDTILRNIKGATFLDKDFWYPKARNIMELALQKIKERKLSSAFDIKPIYLYPKECQIKAV